MYALVLAAMFGLVVRSPILTDQADVIELNHYYDEMGKLVFDQIIFWQWWPDEGALHVRAWRFVKRPAQIPWRRWPDGRYVTIWYDGDQLRRVYAISFRQTWTQIDPEVQDRQVVPPQYRRGLARRPKAQ